MAQTSDLLLCIFRVPVWGSQVWVSPQEELARSPRTLHTPVVSPRNGESQPLAKYLGRKVSPGGFPPAIINQNDFLST